MFSARRVAATSRHLLRNQQPRRYDSHAAHHAPVNESFGRGFYWTVGTVVSSIFLYRVHKATAESGSDSWIGNLIQEWTPSQETFELRNALHTVTMEQAAHDRHLLNSQPAYNVAPLRHNEVFNSYGPYNVPAGGVADLTAVAEHYRRENRKTEEARVARMQDGKVVSIYD